MREVASRDAPLGGARRPPRRRRSTAASSSREGIEDEADNVTRFVWIAPAGTEPAGDGAWKTSLVFSELGDDHPGALVDALSEFSSRAVNLTRIESRPLRRGLGRYMFFCDLEGAASDEPVAEAIAALRAKAETVRVLGSYPVAAPGSRAADRITPAALHSGSWRTSLTPR